MRAVQTSASEPGSCVIPYTFFAFCWAAAGLVHNGANGSLFSPSVDVAFSIAAWAVLLRPTSVPRLALMLAALVPSLWMHAPYITNHWVIYALGSAWLGSSLLWLTARRRALPASDEWYHSFAPALRIATLIVYFWVVFHKLNTSFFDPELSCAVEMYGWLAGKFGLPEAPWTEPLAIWGTLGIETAIPLLLLISRTRLLGILIGVVFHTMLGINGFFNFTAVVTALYTLFLSESFARALVMLRENPTLDRWTGRVQAIAGNPAAFWGGASLAVLLMFLPDLLVWEDHRARTIARYSTEAVWLVYTGALAAIGVLAWWRVRAQIQARVSFRIRGAAWAVVALFLLNGASPYLGFKTENSFSMFSNLRTEGPHWNHLLVPPFVRALPYQDDLVEIVSTNDRDLQGALDRGGQIVFHAFHRHVAERPEAAVTFRRGGRVFRVPRVGDDPALSSSPPMARWLWFRPVSPLDRNSCTH